MTPSEDARRSRDVESASAAAAEAAWLAERGIKPTPARKVEK